LFVSTNSTDPIFVPTVNFFWVFVNHFRAKIWFPVREKYVSRSNLLFKFTFICCHIPHYYVLLLWVTFDAVFSHLKLTNGCTVKKLMKTSFDTLPYLFFFGGMLVETNSFCTPKISISSIFPPQTGTIRLAQWVVFCLCFCLKYCLKQTTVLLIV